MREQRSLADVIGEAKTTAETLKPLDADKEIGTISHVLQSTQECIETTNGMITETEEALRQRVQVLENLQAVMTALQRINDLKTRLHALDPSTEQFVTLAQTADELFNNATDAFKQIDAQENKLPGSLIQHLAGLKERLDNDKHDTADILRCHFLLSGLLNFEYWEKHVGRSKKKGLVIDENNRNHTIHRDIINLIAIAKKDEFVNWNTNADTARALLNEFSLYQTTSKNQAVNRFLTIANEHKYTLTTVSMDPEHHNTLTPDMFPDPESSPLINPARLQAIQPIGKNGFFKRHPRVKTALIIGGIVLVAGAIGVGVYFAVLALPAAALTALTLGIMTLIKTGTLAPIVAGIVTAFAGIGALIGRAIGKRQAAKRAAKHEAQSQQDQITDEQIARDMENIERMVAGFGDSEEAAPERQLTQPLVPPAAVRVKSVPAVAVVAPAGSNPFGERKDTNPFALEPKLSKQNIFTAAATAAPPVAAPRQPNQHPIAAAFKEACIRKCLALRKEHGTLPINFDIEPIVTAAKSIPGYFNEMISKNDFGAAVKAVLSTPKYADFDVNLITDNPKFKQLVDHKQQALAKLEQAAEFRSVF
jgi:membrane protein implicated in regulation of membrane protease activity